MRILTNFVKRYGRVFIQVEYNADLDEFEYTVSLALADGRFGVGASLIEALGELEDELDDVKDDEQ